MSIHSIESFNETEAVNFLKQVLESTHTIKTFFGENDKTPNHDGFFELINDKMEPRKQFIVQIKKTKKLAPNVQGKNKGKYVYELKTNFLEYVKKKVTESPAIYFIVDIEDKRIFWLYLSDEALMNLNFEGKEKVTYAFSEQNILSDISSFTGTLNHIVLQRNKMFVNKSKEEIAEIQDALDYLNHHLDYDLKAIKESVFPNLWRFGIKCSDNPGISIELTQGMKMDCSSAIALYPQIKGTADSGIQEYLMDYNNFNNHLTLGKQVDISEYSKESLNKIIIAFIEKGIPAKYLPDIVLFEIINVFIEKSNRFFDQDESSDYSVNEIKKRYMILGKYVQYILSSNIVNDTEKMIRNNILNQISRGKTSFFDITNHQELVPSFMDYYKKNCEDASLFSPQLVLYISKENFIYLDVLMELAKRNIKTITPIWDYNWFEMCQSINNGQFDEIETVVKDWLSQLASLYTETYDRIFCCSNYISKYKYVFKIQKLSTFSNIGYFYKKYKEKNLSFIYDSNIEEQISLDDKENNLICSSCGVDINSLFRGCTPWYFGISCLLYNGLCDELELKRQSLNLCFNKNYILTGLKFF